MGQRKRQSHIVRFLALALCLLLVTALLPGRAYALSGTTGGLNWSLSAGTLTISGSGTMPSYTDVNMPPWHDSADAITRIVVEEGVTSIGDLAFYGCSVARVASLPSSVTRIGDRAFKNCTALAYVTLPEGLVSIGEAAFERCESLNGILLPDSLRSIGNFAFERCTALTSIIIPAGVTDLGMVAFYHCTGLTMATIRSPIEKVPDWLFYGCTGLTVVNLPETVTETGDQAFHDCENLSTIYYSGEAAETIKDALYSDETTRFAAVSGNTDSDSNTVQAVNTSHDSETSTTTTIIVVQSEEAVITETTTTNYAYTVNGEDATFEEAVVAMAAEEDVEITKDRSTSVSATVSGSDGWQELGNVATEAVANRSGDKTVTVNVQVTGSTVAGNDLGELAGLDAVLTVSTSEGCSWVIDMVRKSSTGFGRNQLDLTFSVEQTDTAVSGIDSSTVYKVGFASDITFNTVVGIPLKTSNIYQYATLFERSSSGVVELRSVVVDENGYAWFPVENLEQKNDYFIAINEKTADTANAIIPDSMKESYGVDYDETLTDASGKKYQVGERESRWGITGKQFTIYAVIVIAAIVLIVTGVMITLNKIGRSKAKYAAMAAADAEDYDIDEEELRLQIMQEMLEEAKRKGSAE